MRFACPDSPACSIVCYDFSNGWNFAIIFPLVRYRGRAGWLFPMLGFLNSLPDSRLRWFTNAAIVFLLRVFPGSLAPLAENAPFGRIFCRPWRPGILAPLGLPGAKGGRSAPSGRQRLDRPTSHLRRFTPRSLVVLRSPSVAMRSLVLPSANNGSLPLAHCLLAAPRSARRPEVCRSGSFLATTGRPRGEMVSRWSLEDFFLSGIPPRKKQSAATPTKQNKFYASGRIRPPNFPANTLWENGVA